MAKIFVNLDQYQKYDAKGESRKFYKPVKYFKDCESGTVCVAQLHMPDREPRTVCFKETNLLYYEPGHECTLSLLGLKPGYKGLDDKYLHELSTVVASVDPTMPYGTSDGRFYFGSKYNGDLIDFFDLIKDKQCKELAKQVKIDDVLKIIYSVMVQLNYLHIYNVAHGDLHMGNIVLSVKDDEINTTVIDPSWYMEKESLGGQKQFKENDIEFIRKILRNIKRLNKNLNFNEKDWQILEELESLLVGYGNSNEHFPVAEELEKLEGFMIKKGIEFEKLEYQSVKPLQIGAFKSLMANLTLEEKSKISSEIFEI